MQVRYQSHWQIRVAMGRYDADRIKVGDVYKRQLQIQASGPLEGITVTADSQGRVKGYVGNPEVIIPARCV